MESSSFWCSLVCPPTKDDNSPLDAVTRAFSEKTKGVFAPATMVYDDEHQLEVVQRKSPANQKIEDSRLFLRKKIIQGNGVTILSIRQYITYVAPVRFIEPATLNATFGHDKGEAEWVSAQDLFGALYSTTPDNAVTVRGHTFTSSTTQSTRPHSLPLALPFTVTLRTREARSELAAILKQFQVDVDASIMPETETEEDAAADQVAALSIGSDAPAAASASAAAASSSSAAAARAATTNYSCRKCRRVLFTDVDLTEHTEPANGGGRFAHKHIKVSEGGRRVGMECSSYFVENNDVLGEFPPGEGPLLCAKCQTRYGNYVWSGAQCSCGEWIAPAFQVVKSKVDARPAGGAARTPHVAIVFQRPPPRAVVKPTLAATATAPAAATEAPAVDAVAATTSQ